MPSHLTRHVFRQILANEPIVHRGCLRRRAYSTIRNAQPRKRAIVHNGLYAKVELQKRTFFNLNMFARRKGNEKEADLDPGIETMMNLAKMQRLRARLPKVEDVADAVGRFFAAKMKHKQPIEDNHAQLALQAVRYCFDAQVSTREGPDAPRMLSGHVLDGALNTLRRSTEIATDAHVLFAKVIYEQQIDQPTYIRVSAGKTLVILLGATGRAEEARTFTFDYEKRNNDDILSTVERGTEDIGVEENLAKGAQTLWQWVLWGFSRQENEGDLLSVLDILRTRGLSSDPRTAANMLKFYLRRNDLEAIRTWFAELWKAKSGHEEQHARHFGKHLEAVLRWCLENKQLDFGHEIVRQAMSVNPLKPTWDAVFVWAAGTGKGPDEINRMMTVMESTNESIADQNQWRFPDIDTINALVQYATSQNDPYMAERFIGLGKERGISPDAQTYVLQMDYRLKVKDVDGALMAYTNLQSMDLSTNEDVPTVNKLIVALCNSKRHDFDTIMNVAADLSDRRVRFDSLTVSKLALLHLSRDEVADVVDLLNTHSFHYSTSERDDIRNAIFAFCIDAHTPLSRSWDAYTVLRSIFDEMPRPQRTDIMTNCFKRERPDMAVHVFNDMRTHSREDTMPTVDTYVSSFLGSARLRDLESLELVHNQLKLDYNIDVNTYLNNALAIGYTACGKPKRALDFWDDIVASKEGPTYNSIHIALRACEKAPFGDVKAQEIWAKLRRQKVELDQRMWASYAAGLAGNGDNEFAISTLEQAEAANELELDAHIIGSLYTAAAGQNKQSEIEEWANVNYPHVWEELDQTGFDADEAGMKTARIDRTVTP